MIRQQPAGKESRLGRARLTLWHLRWVVASLLAAGILLLPAAEAQDQGLVVPDRALDRLSQGALIPYLKEHPKQAPERFVERLRGAAEEAESAQRVTEQAALDAPPGVGERFNRDNLGLPQNEESITACRTNADVVLGGTNDFRGLFDPIQNFTGWHFSADGGQTLRNEGLLPRVRIGDRRVPSGGDPVVVADEACNLYAGSLNYDPETFRLSGIGVYRTTPEMLDSCTGGNDPACWPTRRAVAVAKPGHFLDKEWIYVGPNGSGGTVVWVTYTDFGFAERQPTASIKAVRCRADLSRCTAPISVSSTLRGFDRFVQFSDVTIGPDGRVYVTWTEVQGDPFEGQPQTFIHRLRVAGAGSTSFGPTRTVAVEPKAIPIGGFLNANDFRVATYPKNEVRMIEGEPRLFVVWDACQERVFFDTVCEAPKIKLKTSDDLGASWSQTTVVSEEGSNYFPTISSDSEGSSVAIAYFTNRYDPRFQNQQDVELVTLNPATVGVTGRQRLTSLSNESEADPLLGGFFIGDYIEVFALGGTALVHYNANYRQTQVLESGLPVPQQDNYLIRAPL
jgi:hypothetical protein